MVGKLESTNGIEPGFTLTGADVAEESLQEISQLAYYAFSTICLPGSWDLRQTTCFVKDYTRNTLAFA